MATKGIITFLPATSRTSSGNSGNGTYLGDNNEAVVYLDVTAVSGTTPTLDVTVQDTIDGTNWDTVGSFTQASSAGREAIRINNFSRFMRVSYTMAGTDPDFTFSVKAFVK
ncbi:MAG: hypothetical protein AB7V50_09465 [Vampirovibrionia bacterium]